MIGAGNLIICHSTGWSCSRESVVDMEFDVMPDKTARKTMVIHVKGLFDCVGKAEGMISGAFLFDEGNKVAFQGILKSRTRIEIQGQLNNNIETILKEIKKWQEYY